MTDQVECNCAWNPDSHAETCPVYMQQQIHALRQHKTDYMESAEATRRALEAEITRLKGMLEAAQNHAANAQHQALELGQRVLHIAMCMDDAAHWQKSLASAWPEDEEDHAGPWIVGTVDKGGYRYPVVTIDAAQYDAPGDSKVIAEKLIALWAAAFAPKASRIPAGLYAELEALRTLRDATGVYLQSYMRDEIEDEDNCVTVDQHDAACSVKYALDSARALEWKGGAEPLLAPRPPFDLLAADHKGMRVDYSGLLKQSCRALRLGTKELGLAELLSQLHGHMTELGQRWYHGDTAVVDELLQLYAVEDAERDALKKAKGGDK